MQSEEKDGNYVRSIVAMMNDNPATKSPTKEATPPRSAPSYLSVSRSNNGYNNALLYGPDHRKDQGKDEKDNAACVNGKLANDQECVSLAQMMGPASKNHSKYSDLGLPLKSPEKNCRSFLRNINSFENIGKKQSPEEATTTMVGQKMKHMLHQDDTPAKPAPVTETLAEVTDSEKPEVPVESKDKLNVTDVASDPAEIFACRVLSITGLVEAEEVFDPLPPQEMAGQHFRNIATGNEIKLLTLAVAADKVLTADPSIPDDYQGLLRSASGKAFLLVRERLRQFFDLCEMTIAKKDEKIPGASDLAGFWDMVMIEINSIFASFRDIAKAAKNQWTRPRSTKPPPMTSSRLRKALTKEFAARRDPSTPSGKASRGRR